MNPEEALQDLTETAKEKFDVTTNPVSIGTRFEIGYDDEMKGWIDGYAEALAEAHDLTLTRDNLERRYFDNGVGHVTDIGFSDGETSTFSE